MGRTIVKQPRLTPDDQWFRSDEGKGLLAGSPLTFFSVTDAGSKILDAIEHGQQLPSGHEALTKRLLAVGAVHPEYESPGAISDFTVVIPTFIQNEKDLERLQTLVNSLNGPRIIVVDDCSPTAVSIKGAELLRLPKNGGPAVARNAGLSRVTTPLVAFVDDDTVASVDQLCSLSAHFTDTSVTAVAPRIKSIDGDSLLHEYEELHSPLDLGALPAVVRPLSRVSYVPAAVLMMRVAAEHEVGPFDESLRLGEDVDLIWRLVEEGKTVRYDPAVVCHHEPRSTFTALLRQRFGYGRSAAPLDKKHKFTAAPLRTNVVMLLPTLALFSGYLFLAMALVPLMVMWFVITLRRTNISAITRAKLSLTGWFATVRLFASAVMRAWWPPILIIGQFSLRFGAIFMFSAFVPAMFGLMRNRPRHTLGYIVLRILDPMAYGAGVWTGVFRAHSARCLIPVVTPSAIRLRSKA